MPGRPLFDRKLLFIGGKGGVGKTVVSQAIALRLNQMGRRVLWCAFEDPTLPLQQLQEIRPGLFHINCDPGQSFEEYAAIKIKIAGLARIFLQNKLMRYLAQAAPGIHELVLLGKVWYERRNFDHVVVDMPSTGYGLAMFQSTRNFANLFQGGPVHQDAERMLDTFNSTEECGHLIVSLPEEMPLRESLELRDYLGKLFPENPAELLANRIFPELSQAFADKSPAPEESPDAWRSPVASDGLDYAKKRVLLEHFNLKIWEELKLPYYRLGYEAPPLSSSNAKLVEQLAAQLKSRGYA